MKDEDTEIIGKEICEYLSKTNIKYEWSGNRASCIDIPINNNFDAYYARR